MSEDMVNRPSHYNQGGVECIDAIRAMLGEEGFAAYCRGNAMKYTWRAGLKFNYEEDLKKAVWYNRMAAGDDPRKDTLTFQYKGMIPCKEGIFVSPDVKWTPSGTGDPIPIHTITTCDTKAHAITTCDTKATTTEIKVDPKTDPTRRWPSTIDELLY